MIRRHLGSGRRLTAVLGFACGVAVGTIALGGGVVGAHVVAEGPERALRDVLHTPPSLVGQGRPVTLRYDVVCQVDSFGRPCEPVGNVFVRVSGEPGYRRVALTPDGETALTATVDVPALGISYYAVVGDGAGNSMTVPAAGEAAPQRAWTMPALTHVSLGAHAFGRAKKPHSRVVTATWGSGQGALGILAGRELVRIGPSAFDVDVDGTVVVLDQVNDRLARYPAGGHAPTYTPIAFAGGEGDLALGADGTAFVLDQSAEPVVRSYARSGVLRSTAVVTGTGADMLRTGPAGPIVHAYPGQMWAPLGGTAALLSPSQQAAGARPGRLVAGGVEVVVHGGPSEAYFALVRGEVVRAWRVTSGTKLGEIQLAEPFGTGMLIVLRLWTETKAEFVALVLSPNGLAESFAIDASQWAESAALGRFRLEDKTLYQLRSTSAGAEIVTFDLGGAK